MASTLLKKSMTDLTRRKARAVFAVLTLAIAVASVGIFAASPLMDARDAGRSAGEPARRSDAPDEAARGHAGTARCARPAAERRRACRR